MKRHIDRLVLALLALSQVGCRPGEGHTTGGVPIQTCTCSGTDGRDVTVTLQRQADPGGQPVDLFDSDGTRTGTITVPGGATSATQTVSSRPNTAQSTGTAISKPCNSRSD